jgi:hypothetical protein
MFNNFLDILLSTTVIDLLIHYFFNAFVILPIYVLSFHYALFSFLNFLGINFDTRTKIKCFIPLYIMCLSLSCIARLW